jgi:hypothetical protein
MITLKGTYRNGTITLDEPLPKDLEGKKVEVIIQESSPQKRRTSGSAKGQIWISPDFDEPLEDFEPYMT